MNIFFTSDTHFSHKNIIKYCPDSRGHFSSVEEMNESLISKWNSVVKPNDVVYHLGDVLFKKDFEILDRLNGYLILISGNHDKQYLQSLKFTSKFREIYRSYLDFISSTSSKDPAMILCHYPIAKWDKMYYNSLHLHGHCHSSFGYHLNAIDVGVDARPTNDLMPWEFCELIEYWKNRTNPVIRNAGIESMISNPFTV